MIGNTKLARLAFFGLCIAAKSEPDATSNIRKAMDHSVWIGDVVRVRNSPTEEWQAGTVAAVSPVVRVKVGTSEPSQWKEVNRFPMELIQSATRSMQGQDFHVGDVVRVRNVDAEPWRAGTVSQTSPLLVQVYQEDKPGSGETPASWAQVDKPDVDGWVADAKAAEKERLRKMDDSISVGNLVRVRAGPNDEWRAGEVTQVTPALMVKAAGSSVSQNWQEVNKFPVHLLDDTTQNTIRGMQGQAISVGDIARVRNSPTEMWQAGVVSSLSPLLVKVVHPGGGESPASSWKYVDVAEVNDWLATANRDRSHGEGGGDNLLSHGGIAVVLVIVLMGLAIYGLRKRKLRDSISRHMPLHEAQGLAQGTDNE